MTYTQWKNRKNVKEILGDVDPSPYEKNITNVLENRQVSNERVKAFAYWVIYAVVDDYLDRFDKLLAHPRNDSSSLEIHILRYGDVVGKAKFDAKNNACSQTEKNMILRYGKTVGVKKWNDYKKNLSVANSKEGYIKKYGEEKGLMLYNKQCARNSGNLTLERKQELYGDEIGLEAYNTMNIKQSEKNTLKQFIATYGEDLGNKKYIEKNKVISYKNSLQYYIAQYGEEEGIQRCKNIKDNSSLDTFINRYGEEDGYNIYLQTNKLKIHNLENFINRHGKIKGIKQWKKYSKLVLRGYSMISEELFDALETPNAYYGENEVVISLNRDEYDILHQSTLQPDYAYDNKIIEFNGDFWHGNLEVFPIDYMIPNIKMLASDKRLRDKKRIEILEKRGYKVKVVWENDFRKDREKVIQECKGFLDG